jgi:hypothetical protein
MEKAKGLLDLLFIHLQGPFKKMRLLQMNFLIFFLLTWTNFMKLKW